MQIVANNGSAGHKASEALVNVWRVAPCHR